MCETTVQAPVVTPRERGDWRTNPHELGRRGETVALRSIQSRGWTVLGRNWRSGYGEVDIIALDLDAPVGTVSLIEVKTRLDRGGSDEVLPELAVDEERRKRYKDAARCFLQVNDWASVVRFDVIAITVTDDGMAHMRHIKDAYGVDLA